MPAVDETRPRVPALDGLRALSIICVLWAHASSTRGFPLRWAPDGGLGVRVFFVISGFIITRLMLDEQKRTGSVSLRGFYRRRAGRILPAYWAYLAVIATLGYWQFLQLRFSSDIIAPLTFTQGFWFWPKRIGWETLHTWSLAVEEQFYLLWPPALALLGLRWRLPLALGAVVAGPLLRCWIYQHPLQVGLLWTLPANADQLAWGCLLAILKSDHPRLLARITAWRPGAARLVCIFIMQFAPWYFWRSFVRKCPPLSVNALSYSAQAAAAAWLMASLIEVRKGLLYELLNLRIVAGIGLISYSLYLWQQLFLATSQPPHPWNKWPCNIACVFAAGLASFFIIERPIRSALAGSRIQMPLQPSAPTQKDSAGSNLSTIIEPSKNCR